MTFMDEARINLLNTFSPIPGVGTAFRYLQPQIESGNGLNISIRNPSPTERIENFVGGFSTATLIIGGIIAYVVIKK